MIRKNLISMSSLAMLSVLSLPTLSFAQPGADQSPPTAAPALAQESLESLERCAATCGNSYHIGEQGTNSGLRTYCSQSATPSSLAAEERSRLQLIDSFNREPYYLMSLISGISGHQQIFSGTSSFSQANALAAAASMTEMSARAQYTDQITCSSLTNILGAFANVRARVAEQVSTRSTESPTTPESSGSNTSSPSNSEGESKSISGS